MPELQAEQAPGDLVHPRVLTPLCSSAGSRLWLQKSERTREWLCHQKTQAAQALQCQQQHRYPSVCLGHGIAREKGEIVPAELSWCPSLGEAL